jgi:hypothetical protein
VDPAALLLAEDPSSWANVPLILSFDDLDVLLLEASEVSKKLLVALLIESKFMPLDMHQAGHSEKH